MICWDQAFPEAARILRLKGAEIIFIPAIGEKPLQQMARAKDNGVYVAVSGMYGPRSSRIINPAGEVIATVKSEEDGFCALDMDLNKRHFTYWL